MHEIFDRNPREVHLSFFLALKARRELRSSHESDLDFHVSFFFPTQGKPGETRFSDPGTPLTS